MDRLTIDQYGMALAEVAALRSQDLHFKVGCVLLRPDRTVLATGYNGAPSGVELDWEDRDARRRLVIHAEANAFRFARPGEVDTVYTTLLPCHPCMLTVASYGARRVVFRDMTDPAVYDAEQTLEVARRTGIKVLVLVPPSDPVVVVG